MFELYYVKPDTVDKIRSCWISGAIEDYLGWLRERKYSYKTVSRRIPILVRFGEFAQKNGATNLEDLPLYIEKFVTKWVKDRGVGRSPKRRLAIAKEVSGLIQQMLRCVLEDFVPRGRKQKPENPFGEDAPDFFNFLRQEKGLRAASIKHYSHYLRQFDRYLRSIQLDRIQDLSPPVLSGFVIHQSKHLRRNSIRDSCGVLRVFLRYLYRRRIIARDLSSAVENPHCYQQSKVPRSISWEQVRQMLEKVDRRTPVGKRDYAFLLLLVTYGLRARELASLTLDDIDWRNERLQITGRKAGHCTVYPLSSLVGQAILDYLKTGRPQSKYRQLFLRGPAPCEPLTAAAISGRTSLYLHRAGIQVPRAGSHTLRHTCVQRLVDAELSLKVIGDYVGHRSPSSTQIYSKVALEALREVACGDGEEVL